MHLVFARIFSIPIASDLSDYCMYFQHVQYEWVHNVPFSR